MNILKSRSNKILLFMVVIITILLIISISIVMEKQHQVYENKVRNIMENIIGKVKKQYPEVKEEEIIKLLNSEDEQENGEKILELYGIKQGEQNTILELEKENSKFIVMYSIIGLIFVTLIILTIVIYIKERNKRIDKLIFYIEEINKKNYKLEIENNTEDELSNLRNELYKITIMLKEQAEIEQKEKKELATSISDISHQLKTPLTSISILLDNMRENSDMDKETRMKFIYEIKRQIEWINWLVISLLKLSRLDANVVIFNKNQINVSKLIKEVTQNLAIPIEIKNQKVIVPEEATNKQISFIGDYKWQLEALTNIVKNCVEHTPENKNIYIDYEQNNLYTKIIIRDEGEGIDKKDVSHIFERFYKGKNASENSIGIGLALAKTIIEKENGHIICKSEIGVGTTFEIKFVK